MDALKGRRILILEEQMPIALLSGGMVRDFGCEVAGPAKELADALVLIAENTLAASSM